MECNSVNIIRNSNANIISNPKFEYSTWIAFDLEWQ